MIRKKDQRTKELKIKLTDQQLNRLKAISVLERTTMSNYVRKALNI